MHAEGERVRERRTEDDTPSALVLGNVYIPEGGERSNTCQVLCTLRRGKE